MSDICCCSVKEKIITVRDVVVNQHDLLRSLDGKLRNIAREIGCDPAPEIDPPCGVDSMLAALQENDMWLRDCLDHTCEIIRVLGVVTERCRKCRYYGHIGTYECCDYILEARKRRGCAAGDDCNKFEKRKKKKGYTPIQNPFAI